MRGLIMATMVTAALTGAAQADETVLAREQIDGLLTGNTAYVDIAAGGPAGPGGTAPMYFGSDGRVAATLPNGTTLVGSWRLGHHGYCVDWDNGPRNSCTRLHRGNGIIAMVDAADGSVRGQLTRLVPGNPESL